MTQLDFKPDTRSQSLKIVEKRRWHLLYKYKISFKQFNASINDCALSSKIRQWGVRVLSLCIQKLSLLVSKDGVGFMLDTFLSVCVSKKMV